MLAKQPLFCDIFVLLNHLNNVVGCSEISISVIVKHVQHIGIIRVFCLDWGNLLGFLVLGGTEKIAGL